MYMLFAFDFILIEKLSNRYVGLKYSGLKSMNPKNIKLGGFSKRTAT